MKAVNNLIQVVSSHIDDLQLTAKILRKDGRFDSTAQQVEQAVLELSEAVEKVDIKADPRKSSPLLPRL